MIILLELSTTCFTYFSFLWYVLVLLFLLNYLWSFMLNNVVRLAFFDFSYISFHAFQCIVDGRDQFNVIYQPISVIDLWEVRHILYKQILRETFILICLEKSRLHELITRNASRCNNRDDLLHLRFTLKISIFPGPIYNPVKHLWWSFYWENSKPLNIFIKKLQRRCSLRFYVRLCFLKILQKFCFFKVFYIICKTLEICYFFKVPSFNSSNILLNI